MGQHAMRSPAIGVQEADCFVALVPDLLVHRRHGNYGVEDSPRHFGLCLDVDVANRLVDAVVLGFGWRVMQWTYSLWRVEEGYFCRVLEDAAPTSTVCVAYDLMLGGEARAQSVIGETQKWLWARVGHRYFSQSTLPQTQSADAAFDDAWLWGQGLYQELEVEGLKVGAVRVDREFPPDAMFTSWFNALRTGYGIASNGRERGDMKLEAIGRSSLLLLLSAPNERGAFPTIAGFRPGGIEWFGGHKNFANQMPWGPSSFNTFDMSWSAYWLLRWHEDLGPEPAALDFSVKYGSFLADVQLASGAIPSWFSMDSLRVDPHLRESAQTSASLLFLAELGLVTGDGRFIDAARAAGDYVVREHVLHQRWDDFEVYYSNAPKSEGAADPLSGMSAQDTLSMHFAAAGLLVLYQITGENRWLDEGQRSLDQLLQYQAVWPATFLSLYSFGGFSVQNTDQEWNDARQAQIAPTLLDYARATGRRDYAERGIAALRASYATMCTPPSEAINPRYFDYQPVGWANENFAHNPYDAPTTPVPSPHFDWGVGSALAAFAEVRKRFGDVWIQASRGNAFGIDDVAVRGLEVSSDHIALEIESRSGTPAALLRIEEMQQDELELRINGISRRVSRSDGLAGVEVPATYRGRVVHNPSRLAPVIPGGDCVIRARITGPATVTGPTLHYRTAASPWQAATMVMEPDGECEGTIPGSLITEGTTIEYYIVVETSAGIITVPEVDPSEVPFRQVAE
jgi:hypothetical protein